MSQPIDIVISFDTTVSMYTCLTEVRRKIDETAKRLLETIPNLNIGIIAHGDYIPAHRKNDSPYVTKHLNLTSDPNAVSYFVKNVEPTNGFDAPECYELVLKEARTKISWRDDSKRVLVMIGDDVPHAPAHNPERLDWRQELTQLTKIGVLVHGVQALSYYRRHATPFYAELATKSGGFHLKLEQFNEATEMLLGIAYQQSGEEDLKVYEEELVQKKKMTRSMSDIFSKLSNRDPATGRFKKRDTRAVEGSRFQKIDVDDDMAIQLLVEANGLVFKRGRGFYEFTKRETIQKSKEIIILEKDTGDMYEGDAARDVLGLPLNTDIKIGPTFDTSKYSVFVQSTSNNRKLIGGTTFLYEAE